MENEEVVDSSNSFIQDLKNTMEEDIEKKEIQTRLLNLIKNLSDRDRTILSLYYYEDLSYKEIAQVLSISVSAVSKIHSKILNDLKKELE